MIEGYIQQKDRKNILLLCDDIRMHSGIATMAREFVLNTAHHFNWFNLGAALNHPDIGKTIDISGDINKRLGIEDSRVKVMPSNGYGDASKVRQLIKEQKPDAIFIFTDPRYWIWLFEIEREIRSKIPIFWLNIWDDYPAPMYNKDYYNSVDLLMAISKQTKNINEIVLGTDAKNKIIEYVPHGIDEKTFYPIRKSEDNDLKNKLEEFKVNLFNGKDIEFVLFFNSRNIQRKHPHDVILSYKFFCDLIGKEKAKKCALVMHTEVSSQHGTDLRAVKEALTDPEYVNIFFSTNKLTPEQMNIMYNVADANILISSNEGWGLSLTEALMAGTMIIPNVTGGMQDQARFEDENGNWIDFTPDFPSNHRGTYKKHGEWAQPVFPSNICLQGSPLTPYIFDDKVQPEDAAEAIKFVYELGKEERDRRGMSGRDWVTSEESNMSSKNMSKKIIESLNKGFENFTPRPQYEVIKVEEESNILITHKLTGY
jgi:glycosyltransferase involved in cell wall biosynthesis